MGFLSFLRHSRKFIKLRRGSWEPLIYSQLVGGTGNNLNLQLASEVDGVGGRQSCRTEPLPCGIWWRLRIAYCDVRNPPPHIPTLKLGAHNTKERMFSFLLGTYLGVKLLGHSNSMLNCLRNCPTIFQSIYTMFHSHQQCVRVLIPTHPHHHYFIIELVDSYIKIFAVLFTTLKMYCCLSQHTALRRADGLPLTTAPFIISLPILLSVKEVLETEERERGSVYK